MSLVVHPPGPFTRDRIGPELHLRVQRQVPRDARSVRGTAIHAGSSLCARSGILPTERLRRWGTVGRRPRLPGTELARDVTGSELPA